jgi:hypothetical protein
MPFVEHLIAAGVIVDPTPLTRPLKEGDLVAALTAADTTRLGPDVRATIRRLLAEWRRADPHPYYRAEISMGATGANYAVRDPLSLNRGVDPARVEARAFGTVGVDVRLIMGPIVAASRPLVDSRLLYDPEWYAKTDSATRFAEAYVSGQWKFGELFFGILDRNWGPSAAPGLMLSANPYNMDHFAMSLGTKGIQLQTIATQLDTRTDTAGRAINRYFIYNRLWIRPHGRWTLALWDAGVMQGVGRQFEPWFLNPASIVYFRGSSGDINAFIGVDAQRRGRTTVFAQVLLDDIQVSQHGGTAANPTNLEPANYSMTLGAEGTIRTPAVTWTAYYTQVSNLVYRTPVPAESPLYFKDGTGRNYSDYDQLTLKLSALVRPTLLIEPEVSAQRQGEGDFRLPYPPVSDYPTTPVLFEGVVQRLLRLAVGGRWQHRAFTVAGDAGVHFYQNFDHVTGTSKTQWVGSLGVTYRFHREGELP